MSDDRDLARRAEAAGIMTAWQDYRGANHRVSPETLQAVLDVVAGPGIERGPATLVTATAGERFALPFKVADGARLWLTEEDSRHTVRLATRAARRGVSAVAPDAAGYHRLSFGRQECTLAVAPRRRSGAQPADAARTWGLSAQIYSLYRPGDDGLAGYTALADLVRSGARAGAGAIAISPLHAQFTADPSRFSPYAPSSRLWMNVLHIDPDAAASALDLPAARRGPSRGETTPLVDWPQASARRLAALHALYRRVERRKLLEQTHALAREFQNFRRKGGEALLAHAVFETLHAKFFGGQDGSTQGRSWHWREWPSAFRRYTPGLARRVAAAQGDDVRFHLFLQWLAARQFREASTATVEGGMGIGIIKDIAVGADGGGSEVWSNPLGMLAGASVGAPPDEFNTLGQAWGVTTFSPGGLAADGFRTFIDLLRASLRDAGGIRIDHILGLQRLWIVPHGADPRDGAYLRYPLADLLRLAALEAARAGAIVLGEDLGTVPEGFREYLAERDIRGMQVLWFERDGRDFLAPEAWRRSAAAMTTTHDLPTVAGWWMGKDVAWRRRLKLFSSPKLAERAGAERERERRRLWRAFRRAGVAEGPVPARNQVTRVIAAAIAYVGRTACDLAILPLEDALGRKEQPNLPGTIDQHPNWRRRILVPAGEICRQKRVRERLRLLAGSREAR